MDIINRPLLPTAGGVGPSGSAYLGTVHVHSTATAYAMRRIEPKRESGEGGPAASSNILRTG